MLTWLKEIHENQIQIITKGNQEIYIGVKALIISYDMCCKFEEKIIKFDFKIAIADEAHYLKNSTAKRTETLIPILSNCKHIILLTGKFAL
jgi:SWI/SNF-related matrix-associated actin-dependent regulator 1 of chromatin subfamily A